MQISAETGVEEWPQGSKVGSADLQGAFKDMLIFSCCPMDSSTHDT